MAGRFAKNSIASLFGLVLSVVSLEVIARIAPATDVSRLERPIECSKDLNNQFRYKLECFHRREPYIFRTFTQGKFRPNIDISKKSTNDIGQWSDVDFSDLFRAESSKVRLIAIGDSFVVAKQVANINSFHGRLNGYSRQGIEVVSGALAASGMALPSYLAYYRYLLAKGITENDFIVIPIIANDFDESFMRYGIRGRRGGQGQFFFDENNGSILFHPWQDHNSAKDSLIDFFIANFAFVRYFVYNLNLGDNLKNNFKFFLYQNTISNKYVANTVESTMRQDSRRFLLGKYSVEIFLRELVSSMPSSHSKNNIVFVVDCDRGSIYENQPPKSSSYFEVMRAYFMQEARARGFNSIDLCPHLKSDYLRNGLRFNSVHDGHWNSHGHKIVAEVIAEHFSFQLHSE